MSRIVKKIVWLVWLCIPLIALVFTALESRSGIPFAPSLFDFNLILFPFLTSFGISASVAAISVLFGILFSILLRAHYGFRVLALIPFAIAPIVLGSLWIYFALQLGVAGRGIGVILALIVLGIPYSTIVLSTYWNGENRGQWEVAKQLGASITDRLRILYFPTAKAWIILCFFQIFLLCWFDYGLTQTIGMSQVSTLTLSAMALIKDGNMVQASTVALLLVLPIFLGIFALWRGYSLWKIRYHSV